MSSIVHDLRQTLEGREIRVYELMCENLSNREIAERIDMSKDTVMKDIRSICRKLGVEAKNPSDTQAARRRAILYSGTRIEQQVSFSQGSEKFYTMKNIRTAAKKIGLSMSQIEDLASFLEMD